jgi:hypothetical protein
MQHLLDELENFLAPPPRFTQEYRAFCNLNNRKA